jgi:hypothetical protein
MITLNLIEDPLQCQALFLSVGAMVFATSALAGKEEKVQWSELPAAVYKTITENVEGGKVEEIEKETKLKDGKTITVYEA